MSKLIFGILGLLILIGSAVALHGTPHVCKDGPWTWLEIGQVALGITAIATLGVLIGYALAEKIEND